MSGAGRAGAALASRRNRRFAQDETVRALMESCSFVASASEYEGFGVAAVEGMSAGLIPSSAKSPLPPPGRPYRARHDRRLFRPDAARGSLLRNLARIATELCGSNGRPACGRRRRIDWPRVCQDYATIYEAVTGLRCGTILDVPVQVRTFAGSHRLVDARYETRERVAVAFANAHTLNVAAEDPEFRWRWRMRSSSMTASASTSRAGSSRVAIPGKSEWNGFQPQLSAADEASLPDLLARGKARHRRARGAASRRSCVRGTRSSVVTMAISMHDDSFRDRRSHSPLQGRCRCSWQWAIRSRRCSSRIIWPRRDAPSASGVGALFDFLPAMCRARRPGCKDGGSNGSIAGCRSPAVSRAGTLSAIRCSSCGSGAMVVRLSGLRAWPSSVGRL